MSQSPGNAQSPRAATSTEISAALDKFVEVYPGFEDEKLAARLRLLWEAVQGQPIWAIRKAVDDFVFGVVPRKRPDMMPQPYELRPHVLRLAEAAQRRDELTSAAASGGSGRAYSAPTPQSKPIVTGVTRSEGRQIVESMGYGPGCIWLPGTYREKPELGDVYEPDPNWKGPSPVSPTKEEQAEAARRRAESERRSPEENAAVRERAARIIRKSTLKRPPSGRSPSMTTAERDQLAADLLRWEQEAAFASITEPED